MPKKEDKNKIIVKYQIHKKDTGSAEIQIAILTSKITNLIKHLKQHVKDNHSRRGLLKMVSKRKKLLDYLSNESIERYKSIIDSLKIKK